MPSLLEIITDRRTGNSAEAATVPSQILVLGMHRSGTSAATGLLEACGAFVGDNDELTKPGLENRKGFFERVDTRAICDSLLHAAGADWWKVLDFRTDLVPPGDLSEQNKRIEAVVEQLNAHPAWALKEPRLCLLLPIFRRHLQSQAVCVFVVRSPMEVAQSLRSRNGFPRIAGLALWEAYVVAALTHSASMPRVMLSYAELIRSPQETAEKLVADLAAIGVKGLSADNAVQAIDTNLKHEDETTASFDGLLSPEQRQLWEHLSRGEFPAVDELQLSERARLILEDFEIDHASVLDCDRESDADVERQVAVLHMEKSVETGRAKRAESRAHALLLKLQEAQIAHVTRKREVEVLEEHIQAQRQRAERAEERARRLKEAEIEAKIYENRSTTYETRLQSLELDLMSSRAKIAFLQKELDKATAKPAEQKALNNIWV